MSRRQQLEQMLADSPDDTFLQYGLAMEHVQEGDVAEGKRRLREVIGNDADYQAAYFQLGQLLADEDATAEARKVLAEGIAAAKRVGATHAAEEMAGFLETLDD